MKNFLRKYWFIITIICFAIIKQISVISLKSMYNMGEIADDVLMVDMAKSLSAGKYLGDYNYMLLIKGIGFPIFLSFIFKFNLEYSYIFTFLYTCSLIYLIYVIKDLFKNKMSLVIIYVVLLFNPITYDYNIVQRLYRNGLQVFQLVFIFTGYFALFIKRNKSKLVTLCHSILLGLMFTWFFITREDSLYIFPYAIVVTIIIIIFNVIENKNIKENILRCLFVCIPFILIFGTVTTIKFLNYKWYGTYLYNENTDKKSNFYKTLESIGKIKDTKEVQYCSNSSDKMRKLFKVSPTLREIEDCYWENTKRWTMFDRTPNDDEVEDGWFVWCLRESAYKAKDFNNSKEADEYWNKVYNELKNAIDNGEFEIQHTLPGGISPYRKGYLINTLESSVKIIDFVIMNRDINSIGKYNFPERFSKIYRGFIPILFVVGLISYIIITITILKKKAEKNTIYLWLFITGISLTSILVIVISAYMDISSFSTLSNNYLAPAYITINLSTIISVVYGIELTIKNKNEIEKK